MAVIMLRASSIFFGSSILYCNLNFTHMHAHCSVGFHKSPLLQLMVWHLTGDKPLAYPTLNEFYDAMQLQYNDAIMGTMVSQITSLTSVYSIVIQAQIKENISSLAFVRGIHRWPFVQRRIKRSPKLRVLHTKDRKHWKCFHLMTSSWETHVLRTYNAVILHVHFLYQYAVV